MSAAWPSIDHAALAAHEPAALAQLLHAMQHVGFVYLAASPLEALRADIFALSHAFFALPRETRMRIAMEQSAAFRCVRQMHAEWAESWSERHTKRGGEGEEG